MIHCEYCGKIAYHTEADATRTIQSLIEKNARHGIPEKSEGLHPYVCRWSRKGSVIHVGHWPKTKPSAPRLAWVGMTSPAPSVCADVRGYC